MAYDPIHQSQLYIRRAGRLLRDSSVLRREPKRHELLEGEALEKFYENGSRQLERLAADLAGFTGCTLEGRRALDFGCGMGRLAIPLAERCEHVWGLDISEPNLQVAHRTAGERGLENVDWMQASRLAELEGRYDLVLSYWVFQHIPSREGERIFATLVRGLAPGGVGALHVTLPESRPGLAQRLNVRSLYLSMNSYSLNRLGRVLADAGVLTWYVRWWRNPVHADVVIVFRKDPAPSAPDQPAAAF